MEVVWINAEETERIICVGPDLFVQVRMASGRWDDRVPQNRATRIRERALMAFWKHFNRII